MLIKHDNEEALNVFYEKFKDYGKEYQEELDIYRYNLDKITGNNNDSLKKMSETEFKEAVFYSTKLTKIYVMLSKNITPVLNVFTQEMLLRICVESPYEILREICRVKLVMNAKYMDLINNSYYSGRIFGFLNCLSYEEKNRLLELRETKGTINITDLSEIIEFLPEVKILIEKSLNSDLNDEFKKFIQEHNIRNSQEFEFYEAGVENEKIMNDSARMKNVIDKKYGSGCGEYFTKDDVKMLRKVAYVVPKIDD